MCKVEGLSVIINNKEITDAAIILGKGGLFVGVRKVRKFFSQSYRRLF